MRNIEPEKSIRDGRLNSNWAIYYVFSREMGNVRF